MSTTPVNPVPFPPDRPDWDPDRDPDLAEPDVRTPPGVDSPLTEHPEPDPNEDPDEQLPRDV
jgi:hypothetical protein